jgi:hypothetical protein
MQKTQFNSTKIGLKLFQQILFFNNGLLSNNDGFELWMPVKLLLRRTLVPREADSAKLPKFTRCK